MFPDAVCALSLKNIKYNQYIFIIYGHTLCFMTIYYIYKK
jgi:hypothetical protein